MTQASLSIVNQLNGVEVGYFSLIELSATCATSTLAPFYQVPGCSIHTIFLHVFNGSQE